MDAKSRIVDGLDTPKNAFYKDLSEDRMYIRV